MYIFYYFRRPRIHSIRHIGFIEENNLLKYATEIVDSHKLIIGHKWIAVGP